MAREKFHDKPYDDGTLTKLRIFELYVQEWIPVFLSQPDPPFSELHVFDFFSGPGQDVSGNPGSPQRILHQFRTYLEQGLAGWNRVKKFVHFYDLDRAKIETLRQTVASKDLEVSGITLEIAPLEFSAALKQCSNILRNPRAAKLLIIDQFGVDAVSDQIFRQLLSFPTTDFIFFLASSTLHRFRNHPAIKQKISNPEDSYHVNRAAFDYYKALIPAEMDYFLGHFCIRKRSNLYGLIFGSAHPLGIHKFLKVAWQNDQIAGEANFDVDRENIANNEMLLAFDELKPKKIQSFEFSLEEALREHRLRDEADLLRFCIERGMTGQHAAPIIAKLKKEAVIETSFRIPDVRRVKDPRPIIFP